MAISLSTFKCPECGATLSVEEGREKLFCSYCGSQIQLTNENEHIYRHIDEAGIKQAETERILRIREMELEEREKNRSRKSYTVLFVIAFVFIITGVILLTIESYSAGGIILAIGVFMALFTLLYIMTKSDDNKKANRRIPNPNEVSISEAMLDYYEKNYNSVELLFKAAGFSNVNAVPLHDLSILNRKKIGQVETVTINGDDDFDEGDIFPKNSNVLITYHSR